MQSERKCLELVLAESAAVGVAAAFARAEPAVWQLPEGGQWEATNGWSVAPAYPASTGPPSPGPVT